MKKDLYRFAKARKNKRKEFYRLSADEIKMIEYQYYSKFNDVFGMSGYDLMELLGHSNKQPIAA